MARGDNNPKRAAVERIVRQVLAEVAGRTGRAMPADSADLVIAGRVVSLAEVEGRLSGVARVVVERGAVFTPAARDELKQKGVTIASAVRGSSVAANSTLHVGCTLARYDAGPLVAALAGDGIQVERMNETNLIAAVDELCRHAASETPALLVTGQTAAALCLANRQRGVRGALAADVQGAEAAAAAIGANLLVVEPTGKSVFALRQIARAWLRGGRPACPSALCERLQ